MGELGHWSKQHLNTLTPGMQSDPFTDVQMNFIGRSFMSETDRGTGRPQKQMRRVGPNLCKVHRVSHPSWESKPTVQWEVPNRRTLPSDSVGDAVLEIVLLASNHFWFDRLQVVLVHRPICVRESWTRSTDTRNITGHISFCFPPQRNLDYRCLWTPPTNLHQAF